MVSKRPLRSARVRLAAVLATCVLMTGGRVYADNDWVSYEDTAHPHSRMQYKCGTGGSWTTFVEAVSTSLTPHPNSCNDVTSVSIKGTNTSGTAIGFQYRFGFNSFSTSASSWSTERSISIHTGCQDRDDGARMRLYIGSGNGGWEDRDGPDGLDVNTTHAGPQINIRGYCYADVGGIRPAN